MSLIRGLAFGLAALETAISAAIAVAAARRWQRLDSGARWIAWGNAIHLAFYAITIPLVLTHRSTRLVNEAPFLLATVVELVAFAQWQPRPSQRRLVQATIPLFVIFWTVGQVLQGTEAAFSTISGPIKGTLLTAVAGLTVITRVQATMERWTENTWFWTCAGFMLVYGTEVLFDPTAEMVQSYRPDVALAIHMFRLLLNIVGYGLVLRGFRLPPIQWREPASRGSAEPVSTLTVGSSGTWAIRDL